MASYNGENSDRVPDMELQSARTMHGVNSDETRPKIGKYGGFNSRAEATAYMVRRFSQPIVGVDQSSISSPGVSGSRPDVVESTSVDSDSFLHDDEHEAVGRANGRPRSRLKNALELELGDESLPLNEEMAQESGK